MVGLDKIGIDSPFRTWEIRNEGYSGRKAQSLKTRKAIRYDSDPAPRSFFVITWRAPDSRLRMRNGLRTSQGEKDGEMGREEEDVEGEMIKNRRRGAKRKVGVKGKISDNETLETWRREERWSEREEGGREKDEGKRIKAWRRAR